MKIQINTLKRLALSTVWLQVTSAAAVTPTAVPARPNILFILTDDLGWGDLGVLFQNSRGDAEVRSEPWQFTPNLDKFAAEGAQLPAHYCAAPVCAPSRASLLSGVSQGHANVRDSQFDKALEDNHTLASVLGTAGYSTVLVGKWGLQGNGPGEKDPATWPAYPTKRGFDDFFGYVRHNDGHEHYPKEGIYENPKQVWNGTTEIADQLDKCYTADLWTAWAKQWIVKHEKENSSKPFFMFLSYDTPHAVDELPTQAYPEGGGLTGGLQWLGKPHLMINTASGKVDSWTHPDYGSAEYDHDRNPTTAEVAWPEVYRRYATSVRRIDDAVADVTQLLKDLKIDQDTLVVFSSDNGPSIESYLPKQPLLADFFNSFGPFDGIKRDCLEGGVRVPTLARWPGHIPAGTVDKRPSISYDWLRTFAEIAGVPAPARTDGASLLPRLTGKPVDNDPNYLYIEFFEKGKTPAYPEFRPNHRAKKRGQMQTLRVGDHVGLRYDIKSQADPFEIYDIVRDPQQTHNLAIAMKEMETRMHALSLQGRRPNSSAPRPYDNELVPASPDLPVSYGVAWESYQGEFPWVPDFAALKASASGRSEQVDLKALPGSHDTGMMFSGYLKIPNDGEYNFYLTANTGAVLKLHDATVIDADFGYKAGNEIRGDIQLQAGLHPFRLYYVCGGKGTPQLNFSWSGPGISKEEVPAGILRHSGK